MCVYPMPPKTSQLKLPEKITIRDSSVAFDSSGDMA